MDPLVQIAEDLERRDEAAAAALLAIERLQSEIEELRVRAAAAAAFLRELPVVRLALDVEDRNAAAAQASAAESLRAAETELARLGERGSESVRLDAARVVRRARDDVEAAELRIGRAREERAEVELEAVERAAEAERLERRGVELAADPRLEHDVPPPANGLHGLLDWAARARGELLVTYAALATERDKLVREATELLAGVLDDPQVGAPVAGVRDRLVDVLGID